MPTARCWSLDAQAYRSRADQRRLIPFWPIFLLRFQMFVVYFFGGVTKLDPDWLIDGSPMRSWLSDPATIAPLRSFVPEEILSSLSSWLSRPDVAVAAGWLGMLFDLAIGPMLLFRRTRILGMALAFCFHALNHTLIFDDIGLFPLLAFLATTIFLEPDWPSRLARWIQRPRVS
jgi:hypothetical protein